MIMSNVIPLIEQDEVFGECDLSPSNVVINTDDVTNDFTNGDTRNRTLRPRKSSESLLHSDITRKVRCVSKKVHRSVDEEIFLEQHKDAVKLLEKRKLAYSKSKERAKELVDDDVVLREKVGQLAQLLSASKHAIIYTGAGISTSANIPDYRGVDGVWTQINAGHDVKIGQNPTSALPTFTHMAICSLVAGDRVKYVTSQNCDGLHVRSGVMKDRLSELHGNMYAEICSACDKSFYRIFDVTEKTRLRRHLTQRYCDVCGGQLKDTIVHFGELSDSRWPHNWTAAEQHAEECDLIMCLGSSLKVLRSYKKLWLTDRKKNQRPILCIVNIQWTPKDSQAQLKINGRTDDVMRLLMNLLSMQVPNYIRDDDPLFEISTPLSTKELDSYHTCCVQIPNNHKSKFQVEHTQFEEKALRDGQTTVFSESKDFLECNHGLEDSFNAITPEDDHNLLNSDVKVEEIGECSFHSKDSTPSLICQPQITNKDMPAWFGKGCRKLSKKRGKIKRRRKTN